MIDARITYILLGALSESMIRMCMVLCIGQEGEYTFCLGLLEGLASLREVSSGCVSSGASGGGRHILLGARRSGEPESMIRMCSLAVGRAPDLVNHEASADWLW